MFGVLPGDPPTAAAGDAGPMPPPEAIPPWRQPGAEILRCSSLPTWSDCERRWMAQQRRRLIAAAGYELNDQPPSIGAAAGSGTHAGVAYSWLGRDRESAWAPLDAADDAAIACLRQRIDEDGALYDDTTPTRDVAETAVRKMLRAYREHTRPDRMPIMVEAELAGRIAPNWYMIGHCDLFASDGAAGEVLDDLKTGVQMPAPIAQLGAYRRLIRARRPPPARVTLTYVRRVRLSTDQPPPLVRPIDGQLADQVAGQIAREIVAKVEAFKAGNGSPLSFKANTASRLCGARYCPAFGTRWCPESTLKEE